MTTNAEREARILAVRKMRAVGAPVELRGRRRRCNWCGFVAAPRFMQGNGAVAECRAIAACEGRMR